MSAIPATRTLTAVLRDALDTESPVRLLPGVFAGASGSTAYANVTVNGTTVRVPKLSGVTDTPGRVAYLLATKDFLLCIGGVA